MENVNTSIPFKRKVIAKSYEIEIPIDDFSALSKYEEAQFTENHLYNILDNLTKAHDIDYNGHFGSVIYLSLEADYDTVEAWQYIERIITEQIGKAKAFEIIIDNH